MVLPTRAASRARRWLRAGEVLVVALVPGLLMSSTVLAQIPNPDPEQPPGSALLRDVLAWLKWGALWAAVAGLLIGAIAVGVGHFGSNYGASSAGRKWLLGGMACAAIAGLAWTFANTVYNSTS
jgi:hypothetical protein